MDTKNSNIKIAPSEETPFLFYWNTSCHLTNIWVPQKPLKCCSCKNSSLPVHNLLPEVPTVLSGGSLVGLWTLTLSAGSAGLVIEYGPCLFILHVHEPFLLYSLCPLILLTLVRSNVVKLKFITPGHQIQTARRPKESGEPIAVVSALLGQLGWATSNRRW